MAEYAKDRQVAALEQTRVPNLEEGELEAGDTGTATYDHPVPDPEVPLVLDGEVLKDPARVKDLQSVRLYYTPVRYGQGVALGAFTRREAMRAASREPLEVLAPLALTNNGRGICTNPTNLDQFVCFFEHMHFGGDRICLSPGFGFRDLRQGDWNDLISSIEWCRWEVSLFVDIQFGGDEFIQAAGCDTPYLEAFGWNDIASSAANWGP